MKKYFILIVVLFGALFLFRDERLDEEIVSILFPKSILDDLEFNCSKELYGFSFDGSIYKVYVYDVKKKFVPSVDYPLFQKMYKLDKMDFARWEETPFLAADEMYVRTGMVNKEILPKSAQGLSDKLKYIGNYYSYISSYKTGNYLFVYLPENAKMVVFHRKG